MDWRVTQIRVCELPMQVLADAVNPALCRSLAELREHCAAFFSRRRLPWC